MDEDDPVFDLDPLRHRTSGPISALLDDDDDGSPKKQRLYRLSRTKNLPCGHWGTCGKIECVKAAYSNLPYQFRPSDEWIAQNITNNPAFKKAQLQVSLRQLKCKFPGCEKEVTKWEYYEGWRGNLFRTHQQDPDKPISATGREQQQYIEKTIKEAEKKEKEKKKKEARGSGFLARLGQAVLPRGREPSTQDFQKRFGGDAKKERK